MKGYILGKWYSHDFNRINYFIGDNRNIFVREIGSQAKPLILESTQFINYVHGHISDIIKTFDGFSVNILFISDKIKEEYFQEYAKEGFNSGNELSFMVDSPLTRYQDGKPAYNVEKNRSNLKEQFIKELEECLSILENTYKSKQL